MLRRHWRYQQESTSMEGLDMFGVQYVYCRWAQRGYCGVFESSTSTVVSSYSCCRKSCKLNAHDLARLCWVNEPIWIANMFVFAWPFSVCRTVAKAANGGGLCNKIRLWSTLVSFWKSTLTLGSSTNTPLCAHCQSKSEEVSWKTQSILACEWVLLWT